MLGIHELLNRGGSASPSAQAPAPDASETYGGLKSETPLASASEAAANSPQTSSGSDTPLDGPNGSTSESTSSSEGLSSLGLRNSNSTETSETSENSNDDENSSSGVNSNALTTPVPESSGPEASGESADGPAKLASKVESEPNLTVNTSGRKVTKLHRSRIHPSVLRNVRLIDIALRRKSSVKRISNPETFGSKLHRKFLEAGLRVRLVSCPSIYDIFRQLTPATSRGQVLYSMEFDMHSATLKSHDLSAELHTARASQPLSSPQKRHDRDTKVEDAAGSVPKQERSGSGLKREPLPEIPEKDQPFSAQTVSKYLGHLPSVLRTGKSDTRVIRLIDNNLVDLAGVPSKVLKSLRYDQDPHDSSPADLVGTFNCLDTAVSSVFNIQSYSLVRVTKSASTNSEPSVLVKLETAHTGDSSLIDDGEYIEDMVTSLGRPNTSPSNLFLKKVVARPRYKVDMKLYFVPCAEAMSLYVDSRILERDLINGVVDINSEPERMIYATFDPEPVLLHVSSLIQESDRHQRLHPEDHPSLAPNIPNHITDNIQSYMHRAPVYSESEGYNSGSSSNSRSFIFSRASSSGSSSSSSTGEKPGI